MHFVLVERNEIGVVCSFHLVNHNYVSHVNMYRSFFLGNIHCVYYWHRSMTGSGFSPNGCREVGMYIIVGVISLYIYNFLLLQKIKLMKSRPAIPNFLLLQKIMLIKSRPAISPWHSL